ncbi:hypothetical protein PORCRE_724 [Porphyromonas crevioricanis JCM 15906]|uniref:Type VI secretion protein n=2 Tax=Porphyromonas crevioricanis TaxID=393921 RepID=A0A2X4SVI3_9PORP|nr:hypothetical protein [Porphyromonas crevioricanis]KGN93175.1 hypothetical protein HQ38_09230 [Porphyromonas crevioricanis]SJZ96548.1 hypothetical protein SAMN02745203_01423 [Porphyromonas crevioricanis]SQH73751.1 Uncharacterised protein [Porphyromonas crevioricanis]GAD05027.1 hypothetical protein PORCRE_724 [Porphyromonas crevioricanis JCM 15906]GAD08165.1 hypothetical protein PORCAN_1801 [Porphyromonas crevioricanis JCM 13913]
MGILNYEIGGNEVKIDASEAIADIPENRTLLIEKLTADDPINPETVEGLTTIEEVFAAFQPNVDVEFENAEGEPVKENFRFNSTADFQVKNMTAGSRFLNNLSIKKDFYSKLVKQLRSNKVLQRALESPESRQALIDALSELKKELQETSSAQ